MYTLVGGREDNIFWNSVKQVLTSKISLTLRLNDEAFISNS